jgi:hypothetical protein
MRLNHQYRVAPAPPVDIHFLVFAPQPLDYIVVAVDGSVIGRRGYMPRSVGDAYGTSFVEHGFQNLPWRG